MGITPFFYWMGFTDFGMVLKILPVLLRTAQGTKWAVISVKFL
jgi:hypothetical protein